jgi:hypothetical protein
VRRPSEIYAGEQGKIVGRLQQAEMIEDGSLGLLRRREAPIGRYSLEQSPLECLLLRKKFIEKWQLCWQNRRAVRMFT